MLEYGSKLAEITDFVVMDEKGRLYQYHRQGNNLYDQDEGCIS